MAYRQRYEESGAIKINFSLHCNKDSLHFYDFTQATWT